MSQDLATDASVQETLRKLHFEDGHRMLIAGMRKHYSPETMSDTPQLWKRFVTQCDGIPGRLGKERWGVCFNGARNGSGSDYLCGVTVSSKERVKPDWDCLELPAQRYVALAHTGHISRLGKLVDLIQKVWLPASHYTLANDASDAPSHMERYAETFDAETGLGGIEIWVPIKPRDTRSNKGIKS